MNESPIVKRYVESWNEFKVGQWVEFLSEHKIVRIVAIVEEFDNPRTGFESYHSARFLTETMYNEIGQRGKIEANFKHFSSLVGSPFEDFGELDEIVHSFKRKK